MSRLLVVVSVALVLVSCSETSPSTTVDIPAGEPPAVDLAPDAAKVPSIEAPAAPEKSAALSIEVAVDNTIDVDEWSEAGTYAGDGELIEAIHYGFGATDLYLRVDFVEEILGDDQLGLDIYLDRPASDTTRTLSLSGTPLGILATSMVAWRSSDPIAADYAPSLPPAPGGTAEFTDPLFVGFDGQRIELALPNSIVGNLGPSELLGFRVVPRSLTDDIGVLPALGPAAVRAPPQEA